MHLKKRNGNCVCGPYEVTLLHQTPIFVWYMARYVVKNKLQINMRYNEFALHAQNIDIIWVNSGHHNSKGLCGNLERTKSSL